MPRPHTKESLIVETETEYAALEKLLTSLSPGQIIQPGALGKWSVKDVLAHLYEWQRMFFGWYEAGLRGETPALPAEGYQWSQMPALNRAIYTRYRDMSLDEVLPLFRNSHQQMLQLVHALSAEELTQVGRYAWTGNHTLMAYITGNCGSHYRWARAKMTIK